MEYIGPTKRRLKESINEHITSVKPSHKKTEVSRHFCDPGYKGIEVMEVYVMDFIHRQPHSQAAETLRRTIEYNWIRGSKHKPPMV